MSLTDYSIILRIDPMETAPPPPPPSRWLATDADGSAGRYVYIRSGCHLFERSGSHEEYNNTMWTTMLSRRGFFGDDSGREALRSIFFELLRATPPPPMLLGEVVAMAENVRREIEENPQYADAPVVPLCLFLVGPNEMIFEEDEDEEEEDEEEEEEEDFSMYEEEGWGPRDDPADEAAVEALEEASEIGDYRDDRCIICLEEFGGLSLYDEEEKVVRMPCKHMYHRECVVQWLKRSNVCPLCRCALPKSA